MRETIRPDKEWLEQKYVKEKVSAKQIAELKGVNGTTVFRWLKIYNIETVKETEEYKRKIRK